MNRDAFLIKYRPVAEKIAAETGIPVERILAQAGLESGWNVNPPGNNFFGIKAGSGWSGKAQSLNTTEDYGRGLQPARESFRVYSSPEDSFRDWAKLISSDRYSAALQPGIPDTEYAFALKSGGYATDPDYVRKLANVIETTRIALNGQPSVQTALATPLPTTNIGLGPQPVMQQQPDPAVSAPPIKAAATVGPLAQSPDYYGQAAQAGIGLLAAGAPQQTWQPQQMALLRPRRGDPRALDMLPNFTQRGLLG